MQTLTHFIKQLETSIEQGTFVKLTLAKAKKKVETRKNMYFKLVTIKKQLHLSCTNRYVRKDEVKNHTITDGIALIKSLLGTHFFNANLFTTQADIQIAINSKNQVKWSSAKPTFTKAPSKQHDKAKQYLIENQQTYLQELGIVSQNGKVFKHRQAKFKQINKYVEIVHHLLKELDLSQPLHIADMGCGKGYLTFALYDHLHNKLQSPVQITGVEIRTELVAANNAIAEKMGFQNLDFATGTIENYKIEAIDVLIALHACDTATDEAIYKGIAANASFIICAPCCHKQIRQSITKYDDLDFLLKHGILLERQAEMITDGLRALLLEAHGYKTRIFEFIATDHTPKNLLIVGQKSKQERDVGEIWGKIEGVKNKFGIELHYLEKLLMEE